MKTWLKSLFTKPVVKATIERVWRGGVAGIGTAIGLGIYSVNDIVTGQHLADLWQSFAGGALTALLLALGVSGFTGTGPALNKAEAISTPLSRQRDQKGQAGWVWPLIAIVVLILLLVILLPRR